MGPHLKRGRYPVVSVNQSNTTEILHVGTFAGHIGHGLMRPLWWKGTAQGALTVRAQRYQASINQSRVSWTGRSKKLPRVALCIFRFGHAWEALSIQGVIKGVFQTKASSPWAGNRSERLQVSMCLPNDRDLDTWYDSVYSLPITWPDITDLSTEYLKQVFSVDLHDLRNQLGVAHMRGEVTPR